MSNWIFCQKSHNGILFSLLFKATFQDGFLIGIQVSFSNLYVKLNLLSHIAQWNFHSELLISMNLYGSLISMDISTDMNSSLVLLQLGVKLIFCHISHNGILFAVSFRTVNFWIQEFKSCPESLVAFLIMEPSVLFHSKLWMLNWWTNSNILSHISQWNFH